MIRIIVAGGRDFDDYDYAKTSIPSVLRELDVRNGMIGITPCLIADAYNELVEFVSGEADGADKIGEKFAEEYGYKVKRFPAKWMQDGKYNKFAGFERNEEMAIYASEEGHHGVLIAFWDGKSKGTLNMINNAIKYKMEVHVFKYKKG